MEKINALITSAGRRVSLLKSFKNTKGYNKVFACDVNPSFSAACQVSDKSFKVPRVEDRDYIPTLLDICKKNKIKIVVPTIDTELEVLAKNKDRFLREGILIVVSSEEICKTFYLKTTTYEFFKKYGFKTPEIIKDLKNAKYPLFGKLNNSSLSIGAKKINSLKEALVLKGEYVFQEFIEGIEYTVDVYFDKNSKIKCIVPRERIEVRCGEVSKARTRRDEILIKEIKRLEPFLKGAFGCLTIQLFKRENEVIFIEINPRFGGGYPLSFFAGANYAKFILDDYFNRKIEYFDKWRDNLIMLRYDAEVLVDGSGI